MECDASVLERTEPLRGVYEGAETHPETLERLDAVVMAMVRGTVLLRP